MSNRTLKPDFVATSNTICWTFAAIFVLLGVLNLFLIHPVPGLFYLLLSLGYFPPINAIFKRRLGFSVPLVVKIILGLIVLWGTLAVTDLADKFGL